MEVWGEDDYFLGRSLDVFISKLRKYRSEQRRVGQGCRPRWSRYAKTSQDWD